MRRAKVLRPMYVAENLWVEYSAESLGVVLLFLREQGFADESRRLLRDVDVPKGIHKRASQEGKPDKWVVPHKAGDQTRYRTFRDLDEAKAFQAEHVSAACEEGESQHEDAASLGGEGADVD